MIISQIKQHNDQQDKTIKYQSDITKNICQIKQRNDHLDKATK